MISVYTLWNVPPIGVASMRLFSCWADELFSSVWKVMSQAKGHSIINKTTNLWVSYIVHNSKHNMMIMGYAKCFFPWLLDNDTNRFKIAWEFVENLLKKKLKVRNVGSKCCSLKMKYLFRSHPWFIVFIYLLQFLKTFVTTFLS